MFNYEDDIYKSDTQLNDFSEGNNNFFIDEFNFMPTILVKQISTDASETVEKIRQKGTSGKEIRPNVTELNKYVQVIVSTQFKMNSNISYIDEPFINCQKSHFESKNL